MPAPIVPSRKPLQKSRFLPLPPSAILPKDWPRETVLSPAEAESLLSKEGIPEKEAVRKLLRYYSDTADRRVPLALLQKAKELRDRLLTPHALPGDVASDSGDLTHMALFLYNLTGQSALLELCRMIKAQAPDWTSTFHVFPQTTAVRETPEMGSDAYFRVRGSNIASALKTPALQALFEGGAKNETAFSVGFGKLRRYHGAAHGLFSADPLLAGRNPSRTVDDATVRELLHSLHVLLWAQDDPLCGDILEELYCNALPAARGGQAANQLIPGADRPSVGYDDVTASLWMASADGGLAAMLYVPCEVRWVIAGIPVRLTVQTTYPHGEAIRVGMRLKEALRFTLYLRIPAWAEGATVFVKGETIPCAPGTFAALDREWGMEDEVVLSLPMRVRRLPGVHQSASVMRGPVTYALPVESGAPWNYALADACDTFDEDLNAVHVRALRVPSWRLSGDAPASPPIAPVCDADGARDVRLYPYGRTKARIAQFPVASTTKGG